MSHFPNYEPRFSGWILAEKVRNARDDAHYRAEADLAYEFGRAIEEGDPDATPAWSGTVPDTKAASSLGLKVGDPAYPRRRLTAAEALGESLDYPDGPGISDVLIVLSTALRSSDPIVRLAARQLVDRCGRKFAEFNVEEVDV